MKPARRSGSRRPRRWGTLLTTVVLLLSNTHAPAVAEPRTDSTHWWPNIVFDGFDDFDTTSRHWNYEYGRPGIANHEEQQYTGSTDNVRLDGQGHLVIEAHRTADGYSSGRLSTHGKLDMLYGTISARIKAPSGQGIWPAFWLLGSDIDAAGWPACGEIDIMELVNTGTTFNVSLHGPPAGTAYADSDAVSAQGAIIDLTASFHTYWVTRRPGSIVIGVDQRTLGVFTPESLPSYAHWVFDHPMYAVLNIAVGGDWPGPPDETTSFPATMLVDWFSYIP